jgi:hypothetical protein
MKTRTGTDYQLFIIKAIFFKLIATLLDSKEGCLFSQCCGARAARSRIILVKPELLRVAAPAPAHTKI